MNYLKRRLLLSGSQILALSLAAFLLLSVAPGHFHSTDALDPQRSGASVEVWVRSHGLDKPWLARYWEWLRSCASGDWGTSLAYGFPVSRLLAARAPRTLAIVVPAWVLGWIFGLGLALMCAARRPLRQVAEPSLVIVGMLPEVIVGSLIVWLAVFLRVPLDGIWLPVCILTIPLSAVVFLHAADALAEAMGSRFVRVARARGIGGWTLWRRYIVLAAGNPLLSLMAPSMVGVAGSALAVEALTGWPGLGPLFLEAFHTRNYPVVQAVLVILAATLTSLNLVGDLVLYRLDPRIRLGHETSG